MTQSVAVSIVRQATEADVEQLADAGERFFAASSFGVMLQPSREALEQHLRTLVTGDGGVVFVADKGGLVVGALVGTIARLWFAPDQQVASELAWWVEPSERGGTAALRLVYAFESWAKVKGLKFITMSDLITIDGPASRILGRLGFAPVERAHLKRIA